MCYNSSYNNKGIERGYKMDKSIIFEGKELLRIVLKNCTYADLLEIIGKINLPRDSTMTSVIFSEIKEAYITIRCKTSELEKIQSKLEN